MPLEYSIWLLGGAATANLLILYRYIFWAKQQDEPHSVVAIVISTVLSLEFVLRPLSIATSRTIGWDPDTTRNLVTSDGWPLAIAAVSSVLCTSAILVPVVLATRPRTAARIGKTVLRSGKRATRVVSVRLTLLIATATSVAVALQYGSFGDVVDGSFGRQSIGAGYVYALISAGPLAVLFALAKEGRQIVAATASKVSFVVAWLVSCSLYVLVLGGRAEVITLTVAAVVLMRWRFQWPSRGALAVGILVVVVAASLYRVSTREIYYESNDQLTASELVKSSLRDPLGAITRGDISTFDKLVVLQTGSQEPMLGETYRNGFIVPFPDFVLTAGGEGGSATFTRLYIPRRYLLGTTYEGVSLPGEGMLNFGLLGGPGACLAWGMACGAILRRSQRFGLALPLVVGLFPTVFRSDFANAAALTAALTVASLAVCFVRFLLSVPAGSISSPARYQKAAGGTK